MVCDMGVESSAVDDREETDVVRDAVRDRGCKAVGQDSLMKLSEETRSRRY